MSFDAYMKELKEQLTITTLCFLINKDKSKILLGFKKRGFGEGKYKGIGGKLEQGESIKDAAIREVKEEINVDIIDFEEAGTMTFLFPGKPIKWNQKVHIYRVKSWKGEPSETEEIRPSWFDIDSIPYDLMWDDTRRWMPLILKGDKIDGYATFKADLTVDDYGIKIIS